MEKKFILNRTSHISGIISGIKAMKAVPGIQKIILIALVSFMNVGISRSLPSYARQLGISCTVCHYSFPELTAFGRLFKLNGYTMTGMKTIEATTDSNKIVRLNLLTFLPLSAMVQSSFTRIAKNIEDTQNNSVAFPQQLSVFYAGQVTPHIGTFIQMTYDGQTFGMDNADIRFTNQTSIGSKNVIYGLTLNNNPAVQDVWNTSPAWRFPSAISDAAVNPSKSTIIENLGMQVAGLGAYTLFNNLVFAELTLYRSAQQGAANPSNSSSSMAIRGIAPYWRFALQHQWSDSYAAIGTFGLATNQYISGISGIMDNFTDIGFDLQYEHSLPFGAFILHTSLIKETEWRDISVNQKIKLNFNSYKIDGSLYFKNGLGTTLGYFTTSGSEDPAIDSFNSKPNSDGFIFQIEFLPWYNTKFLVQYIMYNKFDGRSGNYDGFGRNAGNNNTLYVLAWLNF